MTGLGIVIPRSGPGTGPILGASLHNNGVPGATHRYVPERLDLATGTSIATVPDLIGSANLALTGAASAVAPVVGELGGQKYLEFVAGSTTKVLVGTADLGSTFTFATVLRATDKSVMSLTADGYAVGLLGNDTWALRGYTGSAAGSVGGPARDANFVVVFGICAGNDSRLALSSNAFVSSSAGTVTGPNPASADKLQWGDGFPVTAGTKQDVVEQNVWPFALDATQRAAHVAAMKAKWPSLLTT